MKSLKEQRNEAEKEEAKAGETIGYPSSRSWNSSSTPTTTQIRAYEIAAEAFSPVLAELRELTERQPEALEAEMEAAGAPWTPDRFPSWDPE
ncbi:MAG: hypothetical protein ACE5GX_13925 [Thermoanaerobaculia bacterium]